MERAELIVAQAMPQFSRIAEAQNVVVWSEESQFATQALQRNKQLRECDPTTIQNAIINVAATGLTLNPADGYAYLIPEYNKQTKQNECQLRISFKGLTAAATSTGICEWIRAEVVKENDTFNWLGVDEKPEHKMQPFGDRGQPVGVYCVAKLTSGDFMCEVMQWEEVKKIQACAKAQSVWSAWPEEMAKKAVIKRAAKQWPKNRASSVLHKTIEVMNDSEGNRDPMAEMERTADDILTLLDQDDLMGVGQIWTECTEAEQATLWTAKTKGGWFTMEQKSKIREAASGYAAANHAADAQTGG